MNNFEEVQKTKGAENVQDFGSVEVEMGIVSKFTLEEIYLIRTCNLKAPDRDKIISVLKGYLDLTGMEGIVRNVLGKLEKASAADLQKLWEFSLD